MLLTDFYDLLGRVGIQAPTLLLVVGVYHVFIVFPFQKNIDLALAKIKMKLNNLFGDLEDSVTNVKSEHKSMRSFFDNRKKLEERVLGNIDNIEKDVVYLKVRLAKIEGRFSRDENK